MESYHLEQMQSLPLEGKIVKSLARIREWLASYPAAPVCISGLDSAVVLHLVRKIAPNTLAVFSNTGLEYPEVVYWARKIPNHKIVTPTNKFSYVIKTYGYPVVSKEQAERIERGGKVSKKWRYLLDAPFKISAKCCNELKKKPLRKFKHPFLGLRAEESALRRQAFLRNGCNVFRKRDGYSAPVSFWRREDIVQYVKENNIIIPSIYGEMTSNIRTGCVLCLFGIQFEYVPNRIQRLYYTHPGLWRYGMRLGIGEVMEFMGIPHKPSEVDYAEKRRRWEMRI